MSASCEDVVTPDAEAIMTPQGIAMFSACLQLDAEYGKASSADTGLLARVLDQQQPLPACLTGILPGAVDQEPTQVDYTISASGIVSLGALDRSKACYLHLGMQYSNGNPPFATQVEFFQTPLGNEGVAETMLWTAAQPGLVTISRKLRRTSVSLIYGWNGKNGHFDLQGVFPDTSPAAQNACSVMIRSLPSALDPLTYFTHTSSKQII